MRAVGVLDCVGSAGHFLLIFRCEIMITERGQQQKRVFEAKCIIDHVTYFKNPVELFLWSLTLHSTDMEEHTGDSSNVLGKRKERDVGGEERANLGYVSKQL